MIWWYIFLYRYIHNFLIPSFLPVPAVSDVDGWPSSDSGVTLGQVSGIAVDSAGNVHIFHRASRPWDIQWVFMIIMELGTHVFWQGMNLHLPLHTQERNGDLVVWQKLFVLVIAMYALTKTYIVGILPIGSGDGAHWAWMNPMTRVIISVKRLETVFHIKCYINPDYYYIIIIPLSGIWWNMPNDVFDNAAMKTGGLRWDIFCDVPYGSRVIAKL